MIGDTFWIESPWTEVYTPDVQPLFGFGSYWTEAYTFIWHWFWANWGLYPSLASGIWRTARPKTWF